jgi:hypothetical protein
MANQKQSDFTTVTELSSSAYIPAFTTAENEKISRDNFFSQVRDFVNKQFIYKTIDLLQAANLETDEDDPVYVRVEETGYALYKITSVAAQEGDIELDNGTVATYQIEGSFREFDTVADVAAASLPNGMMIYTRGADAVGDGGHAPLLTTGTEPDIVDGYCGILLASGNWAVLQPVNGSIMINQFGIGADATPAITRANAYAAATGYSLRGTGNHTLSTALTLTAPCIDLFDATLTLADNFPTSFAVTYQATSNDYESRAFLKLNFDGNRDNQSSARVALKVRATPTPQQEVYVSGKNCNLLLNVDGNAERGSYHVFGALCDNLVEETGDSPDTNTFYISGGNCKQFYKKTSSTTSNVYLNCQIQDVTSTLPPVEILNGRGTTLHGELRGMAYGAVKLDHVDYVNSSGHFVHFADFSVQGPTGSQPILLVEKFNYVSGKIIMSTETTSQPANIKRARDLDLNIAVLDSTYADFYLTLGNTAGGTTVNGKISITSTGAEAASKIADVQLCGSLQLSVFGSAQPITIASGVSSDVLNLSLPREYITNNVAITHNSVRASVHFRGQHLTAALLAHLTAVGTAGIPRGSNAWNVNTNGLNFFDGAVWKYVTTSTTLV